MKRHADKALTSWKPQPYFRHTISTPRQMDVLNEVGGIAIEFRTTGSWETNKLQLEGSQSETLCVWRTQSRRGFVTIPREEFDIITIRFVVSGRMIRRHQSQDYVGMAGLAMFVPFEAMVNEEASDGFESFGGTITRQMLHHGHRVLEGNDGCNPDLEPIASTETRPMRAFMESFHLLIKRLQSSPTPDELFLPLHEEIAIFQLLTAWPRRDNPSLQAELLPSKRVRLALDFIDANLARSIKLEDVAGAAHSSVRSLQQSFKKELNTTPVNHIMEKRLERVRQDLVSTYREENSISEIAKRWGFVHISDFSQRFRKRYGYVPSDEVRRGDARKRFIRSRKNEADN